MAGTQFIGCGNVSISCGGGGGSSSSSELPHDIPSCDNSRIGSKGQGVHESEGACVLPIGVLF
jgi:hypothetical protein